LEAVNAANGESLAQAQSQAPSKEAVLNSLHEASSELRRKLGESLASVQKFDKPLSEATTSSLEALKAFSLGDSNHFAGKELDAVPLYLRAVELDPNFAMAYARLGSAYSDLGQTELAEQNRDKAFELRDRASEHEKLYITEHYYADDGQLDKGIAALELYKQTYPRDWLPYSNVATIYMSLGQFDNALQNSQIAVQLNPDSIASYNNLAGAYLALNRLDEAKATLNQAVEHKLTASSIHGTFAFIAWLQNDPATMERELQLEAATPDGALNMLYFRQGIAAYHGRLQEVRDLGAKIREADQRLSLKQAIGAEYSTEAVWEGLFGQKARAIEDATQALKISQAPNVVVPTAFMFALVGEENRALKLADQVAKQRPYDTLVQYVSVPDIKALVAINHGDVAKASDLLDGALIYGRVDSPTLYMRGLTYLKAGQAAEAAQAFQRQLNLKTYFGTDVVLALDQVGLARAYALQGDKPKSRIAYQDFLSVWKDASPEIPLLREAKAEYARLQ
jgi:tetratricopeptide (TPR) repeat protein